MRTILGPHQNDLIIFEAGSSEYIFLIILEFLGLTFFSFLMGTVNGNFNTSDSFDDLIEEKLDSLDMWIKKIEKSNKTDSV